MNMENLPLPTEDPWLDPVVRAVLDSRRLTFEDETTVRHEICLAKPSGLLSRACSTGSFVVGLTVLGAGGLIHWYSLQADVRNVHLSVGRTLGAAVTVGAVGIAAREVLRRSLIGKAGEVLDELQDTSSLCRKISRWILDNEVLQRGYAVATARDLQSKGDALSHKACLRLRRSAFIETRHMVFILRAVAVDLLKTLSREKLSDPLENHICLIPLEEFGDSLSILEAEPEALFLSTDGFSLQATKSLTGLLDLQVSEFLKLLCAHRLEKADCLSDLSLYRRLRTASALLSEALGRMRLEYQFETDEAVTGAVTLRRPSTLTGVGHPPDYLRSLELHLTAALKDVRMVLSDVDLAAADELQKVAHQDRLEKLGYHVKCSTMLLDYLKRKNLMDDQTPSTDNADVSPTASDFEIRPVVTGDDEIVVEDDIFEALVMEDAAAEHRGEPVFSELNHFEEQKQQSKMVLEEIKSVLSVRSADWQERERKARERKGLPATSGTSETSEEVVAGTSETSKEAVETDRVVPSGKFESVTEEAKYTPEMVLGAAEMARVAAAVGTRWRGRAEDQFGSDDSQSETETG